MPTAGLVQKFRLDLKRKYSQGQLDRAARAFALEMIKIARERTNQGIDIYGRRFTKYSPGYLAQKKAFIKNNYRVGKGRGKKRQLVGVTTTEFAAKSTPNWMRRTGRLFSAMAVKAATARHVSGGIQLNAQIDFSDEEVKKYAQYLIDGTPKMPKRAFWGLSKKASNAYISEQNRLKGILKKELRLSDD